MKVVERDYSKKCKPQRPLKFGRANHEVARRSLYTSQNIIEGNLEILHTVANRLLETETINKDEFESLSENVMWNHNPLIFA